MIRLKSPQSSFYGSYLYDRIVPEDHLLRKINRAVDFSFVHDLVRDRYIPHFGRPAEDPEFMLRLCLLQYLYGDSDRRVIENARMHLAYKYFLGLAVDDEVPDDTTISYFRVRRLGEEKFREIFENIVQQCIDSGLVTGSRQIVDSTHVVADIAITSLTGLLNICRRNVLEAVAEQDRKMAERMGMNRISNPGQIRFTRKEDGLEKELDEAKNLLDGVTDEFRQGSLKAAPELRKSLELLEKAVADREDAVKDRLVSPVDPDARRGRKESKRWVGYKGHLIMEEDSEIITAIDATPANAADGSQLKGLLKQQEHAYSLIPEELTGDKAYDSGANLDLLDIKGISGVIRLTKKTNHMGLDLFTVDDFRYDADTDTLQCPGRCITSKSTRAVYHRRDQTKKGVIFQFSPKQCNPCALREKCNRNSRGRAVYISYYHHLFQEMRERLGTPEGQEAIRSRSKIEHRIANLTRYCGMRRSRYRGMSRIRIHILLSAIASNVKRMARLLCPPPEPLPPRPDMAV